ncbi:MAG: hypothetical protein WC683_02375 [bacterium]
MAKELNPSQYGIFAGSEALGDMDDPAPSSDGTGYKKRRYCEYCSAVNQVEMTWAELYCLSYGLLPQQVGQRIHRPDIFPTIWQYNQKHQCFHPRAFCQCGDPRAMLLFDMTPTEAERLVSTAARNGVMSQEQKAIIGGIQPVVTELSANRRG